MEHEQACFLVEKETKVSGGTPMRLPDWTGVWTTAWGIADVDWKGTPAPTCTLGIIDELRCIYIKWYYII